MTNPARRCIVALLGALDRFNYGDLLFHIVAKKELTRYSLATEPVFEMETGLSLIMLVVDNFEEWIKKLWTFE
jgi:hypothetical protein